MKKQKYVDEKCGSMVIIKFMLAWSLIELIPLTVLAYTEDLMPISYYVLGFILSWALSGVIVYVLDYQDWKNWKDNKNTGYERRTR